MPLRTPIAPRRRAMPLTLAALILFTASLATPSIAAVKGQAQPAIFFKNNPDVAAYKAGAEAELAEAKAALETMLAVKGKRTIENTLVPYNLVMAHADNVAYQASLMESSHPDSVFRSEAEHQTQVSTKFLDDLSLNRDVFEAIQAVDISKADGPTRYFVERTIKEFRRSGVDKDEATRRQIAAILEELTKIGQEFDKNIRTDSRFILLDSVAELDGLPEDFIKSHQPGPDGKIKVSIEYPDLFPVVRYAKSSDVRKRLMAESQNRGYPVNMAVLDSLIAKRYRLAQLLGYPNWAEFVTENKMIANAANAENFISRLNDLTLKRAKEELTVYLKRKQEDDPAATQVDRWEVSYYGRLIRMRDYDFDPQAIRPYFAFKQVKQGVFDVTGKMFGVTYKKVETPVWHPSVEAYEVYDGKKLLGRFFLDLHPRPGKFNHAARFGVRQGSAGLQLPEAALLCNFPGDRPGDPGLMEHSDVETFFHEFGHLIHSIFGGHGRWEQVNGTSTERDFVEAPSQLLEEWCWDTKTLQSFAKHHETGQPIPADMVEKMQRADGFGRALGTATQVFYSAVSLNVYNRPSSEVDHDKVVKELEPRYSAVPPMEGTHMQCSFGHLDGYSAVYYTYQWSLVIAKDMFSRFNKSDLLDTKVARRYRDTVLAVGGSRPARESVKAFLGREYDFKAYDEWLAGKDIGQSRPNQESGARPGESK
ncbi:MAG TPA: M3 family metallopeptidase [Candidatus Eisenbacteria bacterium]|nr:M3 family metallopeptidase [Candidatus Eisenbacteria bacterium]